MNRNILLMAIATMCLASCSKDADPIQEAEVLTPGNVPAVQQVPVAFGAYVNRAMTRAGYYGALTTSTGEHNLQTEGFGVFAFYTDDDLYSPVYQPNFMYNNWVHKEGENWTYEPVRYWPNETGANAGSVNVDRLSFFAYAPWVPVKQATGVIDTDYSDYAGYTDEQREALTKGGIVGLSRNGAVGDPTVMYNVSLNPARQVDFCWGVAPADFALGSSDASTTNTVTAGAPFLDIVKPTMNEKIQFDFKHALTALNIQLDTSAALDINTKVYVRQITFEGFAMKGVFNLNTDRANWYDLNGTSFLEGTPVTVYDGRINGREARGANTNETPTGLNPQIVQQYTYDDIALTDEEWLAQKSTAKPDAFGVTYSTVNLFDVSDMQDDYADPANPTEEEVTAALLAKQSAPVYVIPTGRALKVTIVYDVETVAPKLPGILSDGTTHGSHVESSITRTVVISGGSDEIVLENGKRYTIRLHLGMMGVDVSASVGSWEVSADVGETELTIEALTLGAGITPWDVENVEP